MPKKEIVIFNVNVLAGVSSIIKNILKHIPVNNEITYKLVLYSYPNNRRKIDENWIENINRIELNPLNNAYKNYKILASFLSKDSIIIANDQLEIKMAVFLKLKNPLVYIVHGDFNFYYKLCLTYQDYLDLIIVYSKHIYEKLHYSLEIHNRSKVIIIYYPVPQINNTLKESASNLRLIFIGSLVKRKGIDHLPKIVNILKENNVKFHLSIIGDGSEKNSLYKYLSNFNCVDFKGFLTHEKVIEELSQSDVLLFPTKSEGLPNVLIESMKAGCVPIVSNIPSGIPDIVEDGKNGFLVEVGNEEMFAEKVIYLDKNRDLLKTMKYKSSEKANTMFDPKINTEKYLNSFLGVFPKNKIPDIKYKHTRLLDQPWIPNGWVVFIRTMKINQRL